MQSDIHMAHIAVRPFQEKILNGLYFLARRPAHELCECGEVENMVNDLKSHIYKCILGKVTRKTTKKKISDERKVEIKIPKIK